MFRSMIGAAALTAATAFTFAGMPYHAAAQAAALDDATVIAVFDAANSADIETGRLAVERGQSKEVRDFGAVLVRDHEAVRQMGRDLAAKLAVTPTPPSPDAGAQAHAQAVARLRALSGAAFDRAFLEHEGAFHEGVIEAVQTTLLPAIQNPELRALVEEIAPAFEAHMRAAQDLARQLGSRPRH
jgi:putative membrane protein